MPPWNSWLQFSLRTPFVLLLALLLIGLVVALIVFFLRLRIRVRKLSAANQALGTEQADHGDRESKWQAAAAAYRSFIYNLSHEVSNPLQSIQTNLDNMADCGADEPDRWRHYHAAITAEVRRLSVLTENLRLLSHLETPDAPMVREPVNVKGVVEEVIMAQHDMAEARRVRLRYVGPERPARVLGDRDGLYQVLRNLVENGIKYSRADGGTVIIGVQEGESQLSVRVSDEGVGIAPEDLPHIFDTAYRAPDARSFRRRGSGLGLAIVKRIVEQHGGEIQVHSQPGEGTTFAFSLPLYRAPDAAATAMKR